MLYCTKFNRRPPLITLSLFLSLQIQKFSCLRNYSPNSPSPQNLETIQPHSLLSESPPINPQPTHFTIFYLNPRIQTTSSPSSALPSTEKITLPCWIISKTKAYSLVSPPSNSQQLCSDASPIHHQPSPFSIG